MSRSPEQVWILDNDSECENIYRAALVAQYTLLKLSNVAELTKRLSANPSSRVLLICDPAHTSGSVLESFGGRKKNHLQFPNFIVSSKRADVEFLRFFLDAGAKDFLLKPLHQAEVQVRVERAFALEANQEVLILRHDLDGIQIQDLTFREHQLLTILLSRPNRSASRNEIQKAVWNKVFVNRKTLDVHLFNLRRKIRPYGYDVRCQKQTFRLCKLSEGRIGEDKNAGPRV